LGAARGAQDLKEVLFKPKARNVVICTCAQGARMNGWGGNTRFSKLGQETRAWVFYEQALHFDGPIFCLDFRQVEKRFMTGFITE
jgi:hypothetical protein